MRKLLLIAFIGLALFIFATTNSPKAEALAQVSLSQTILAPDCYDIVSSNDITTDYIAVFDCEYRTPEGKTLSKQPNI